MAVNSLSLSSRLSARAHAHAEACARGLAPGSGEPQAGQKLPPPALASRHCGQPGRAWLRSGAPPPAAGDPREARIGVATPAASAARADFAGLGASTTGAGEAACVCVGCVRAAQLKGLSIGFSSNVGVPAGMAEMLQLHKSCRTTARSPRPEKLPPAIPHNSERMSNNHRTNSPGGKHWPAFDPKRSLRATCWQVFGEV